MGLAALLMPGGCAGVPVSGGYARYTHPAHPAHQASDAASTRVGPYAPLPATILNPAQAPAVLHDPKLVRVRLLSGREAFDLSIDGAVEITDGTGRTLDHLARIAPQPVTLTGNSLAIGNHIYYGSDRLQIKLRGASHCRLDDEELGDGAKVLTIYRTAGERQLQCVVSWEVEAYLYGVLSGEVPVDWPAAALQAQAVASRTYVLYAMQDRRYQEFDVERTTSSQVFKTGDQRQIDRRVIAAVDATCGEFLTSAGVLFPTYFHSTCGGETAGATDVFGGEAAPALTGHRHETACSGSKVYRWTRSVPLAEFETRLVKKGLWDSGDGNRITNILPIGVAEYGRAMRATRFEIIGVKRRKFVGANEFRLAFGGGRNDLPSTLFAHWTTRKGVVTIDGQGWGHGVGMCQFGALGRAQAGDDYRQILSFYYRDAELQKSADLASAGAVAGVGTPVAMAERGR